ncbi:uncharacterized protein LOC117298981 [Asterias rubens]|uniref:uncharacterized protein LOC117298981 n=1 Tax=Asterias rubens TaxID=7604 RepID=UPI00145504D5|nr:uncharacterized protein LOC117298981 [Asterias rubens]
MDSMMKQISRNIVSLLVMIFYVLPLNGEMCSTMNPAVDGEHLSALQTRAFFNFRSTCRKESFLQSTTLKGSSLCGLNTYRVDGRTMMELQLPMTSPVRLRFTVSSDEFVWVIFPPTGPGFEEALHVIHLLTDTADFPQIGSSSNQWIPGQSKSGVNYIGVPVIITYKNGRFEVAVQGVPESTLTYDVTYPPKPSWFISFYSYVDVKWNFAEPCIYDFNPQFTVLEG